MSRPATVHLGRHSWTEIDARWETSTVLVPLGATEQHGPHLPLDTDTIIAQALCDATAAERPGLLVAPPVPYGASGEHADFPGTISIGTAALTMMLVELGRSLLPSTRTLIFVSAHGGNSDALVSATEVLTYEQRNAHIWTPRVAFDDLHAGRTETSLMLHLAPETVRMSAAVDMPIADDLTNMALLRSEGVAALSPSGVLGTPSQASAEHGRVLFETLVADLGDFLDRISRNVDARLASLGTIEGEIS